MASERDVLVKKVFPELRERLLPYRIKLVDIDLRWGITEEQAERILENGLWPSRCRDGHRGPRPDAPSVEG